MPVEKLLNAIEPFRHHTV
nr:unnamed protein product [Callosobruchus chinensis]